MASGSGDQERYELFVREYAHRAMAAAAEACATALALKFPVSSRKHNETMYRRVLEARFAAIVDELGRSWSAPRTVDPDSPPSET